MRESQSWYQQLNKPSWAPNESLFGTVWSFLYPIIIGVNLFIFYAYARNKIGILIALPFWINLVANLAFTLIQFGLRNYLLASIDIIIVLITILWAMIAIWPYSKWVTLAFVPYLVWVSIASILQISITIKN